MEAAALSLARPRRYHRLRLVRADDGALVARVRAGDDAAFAELVDRHAAGLVAFSRHMLGSREEAEDAVQHTFLSAYRAICERDQDLDVRPWLYAIARNRCISVLRTRREERTLDPEFVATEGLAAEIDRRAELRELLADVARLPEDQRAALVLFEMGDRSHEEIAQVLGVRRDKVKALIYQAREHLMAARQARDTPCLEIRQQLATLSGARLRRGTLRRHVDECSGCQDYQAQVRRQRAALGVVLPVVPSAELADVVVGAVALVGLVGSAGASGVAGFAALSGAGAKGALVKALVTATIGGTAGTSGAATVAEEDLRREGGGRAVAGAIAQPRGAGRAPFAPLAGRAQPARVVARPATDVDDLLTQ